MSPSKSSISLNFRSFNDPITRDVLGMDGPYVYTLCRERIATTVHYQLCRENIFIPNVSETMESFEDLIHLCCFSRNSPLIYLWAQPLSDVEFYFSIIAFNRLTSSFVTYRIHREYRDPFSRQLNVHFCQLEESSTSHSLFLMSRGVSHTRTERINRFEIRFNHSNYTFIPLPSHLSDFSGITGRFREPLSSFPLDPAKIPLILVMRDGRLLVYNMVTLNFDEFKCSSDSHLDLHVLTSICREWDAEPSNNCVALRMGTPGSPFSVMERGPFPLFRLRDMTKPKPNRTRPIRHDTLYRISLDEGKREYSLYKFQSISYTVELSLNHAYNERFCTVFERFCSWQAVFLFDVPTLSESALWGVELPSVSRTGKGIPEKSLKKLIGRNDDRLLLNT